MSVTCPLFGMVFSSGTALVARLGGPLCQALTPPLWRWRVSREPGPSAGSTPRCEAPAFATEATLSSPRHQYTHTHTHTQTHTHTHTHTHTNANTRLPPFLTTPYYHCVQRCVGRLIDARKA